MGAKYIWRKLIVAETDVTHRFLDGELEKHLEEFSETFGESLIRIFGFGNTMTPTRVVKKHEQTRLQTKMRTPFALLSITGGFLMAVVVAIEYTRVFSTAFQIGSPSLLDYLPPVLIGMCVFAFAIYSVANQIRYEHRKVKKFLLKRMNQNNIGVIPGSYKKL